ncbi:MAG: hypothetical protein HQ463_03435 [Bacteroidetes bacterium]|nr:hypothetical protein [Bacteroidota bacterium]
MTIKFNLKFIFLATISLFGSILYAQKMDGYKLIDAEQDRIDLMDTKLDKNLAIGSESQNQLANKIYFTLADKLQADINVLTNVKLKEVNQRALYDFLRTVQRQNIYHFAANQRVFELVDKIIVLNNETKELELLKTDLKTGILIGDFINLKPYAKAYWLHTAQFYPTDLLNKFKNLAYSPIGSEVINAIAKTDPIAVKQYFGTNHIVDRALKNSKDTVVQLVYTIYKTYGMQSKAYALLHYIYNKQMDMQDANTISKNPKQFYKTLIELRKKPNILGNYAVDKELQTLGMERVVEINLRHDKTESVRFAPIDADNAYEIYTAIVYSPEEIFTSSFLGMYKRMMEKKKEKSGYLFLQKLNFNKFRIFVKQCAGYNKLDDFFGTMNDSQANALVNLFASDLYNYGGNLGPAVDVADTYGSLENDKIKKLFKDVIETEYKQTILTKNDHGIKIYGLLLKLIGGQPENLPSNYTFNIPNLDRVTQKELFPDSIHIQQHFFFDDEDGQAAFNAWLTQYPATLYKKDDKGTYVVLSTLKGKKILIYANKPKEEFAGRNALTKLFESKNRFPDLIVHRGHSYYIENTLANMTNSNRVAILGSCGGYQNISKAMENAMDVQIVSTKQVGTLVVNSVLINETTETIRQGKDLVWIDLWKQITVKLKDNPQFKDYIPPYKNLGARFIKAYNML